MTDLGCVQIERLVCSKAYPSRWAGFLVDHKNWKKMAVNLDDLASGVCTVA